MNTKRLYRFQSSVATRRTRAMSFFRRRRQCRRAPPWARLYKVYEEVVQPSVRLFACFGAFSDCCLDSSTIQQSMEMWKFPKHGNKLVNACSLFETRKCLRSVENLPSRSLGDSLLRTFQNRVVPPRKRENKKMKCAKNPRKHKTPCCFLVCSVSQFSQFLVVPSFCSLLRARQAKDIQKTI